LDIDWLIALAGLLVGFTVGLTGMGGGALMTPILVLVFNVQPLAAVSSDLVAAMVMKPIGGGVHLRRGTVNTRMVGWLCLGSVPAAFTGVLILDRLGDGAALQERLQTCLGIALLVAAAALVAKAVVSARRSTLDRPVTAKDTVVRPGPTLLIGLLGGLIVGMTSVGSGSLMMVLLLWLYPKLKTSDLVGTDLVQAIPLVASAAIGHLFFGDFQLGLTSSLLIGSIPGVYIGARLSSSAPDSVIRPALVLVLSASALKLLGVSTEVVGALMLSTLIVGGVVVLRRWLGRRAESSPAGAPTASEPLGSVR
jgi:uncharacterized membrane protein YfcA